MSASSRWLAHLKQKYAASGAQDRVLVTGAFGQIGRDFLPCLREIFGTKNVIASDVAKPQSETEARKIGRWVELDVTDKGAVKDAMNSFKVNRVIHLATMLSAVGEKLPMKAHDVNVQGTLNIFEVAREIKQNKSFTKSSVDTSTSWKETQPVSVFAPSSIAVFGPSTPADMTPDDIVCAPTTMYGISKLHLECLGSYYRKRYGIDFRSLRYPGIISASAPGGGTTDYVMDMYKDSWKYKQCESFLSEDMELPFMHMDDCLRAAMELIMAPKRMLSRPCYNITAFSATPKQVFESIKKFIPECTVEYNADERELIARSWPNSIDDSVARQDWEWRHTYDLDKITEDILNTLEREKRMSISQLRLKHSLSEP